MNKNLVIVLFFLTHGVFLLLVKGTLHPGCIQVGSDESEINTVGRTCEDVNYLTADTLHN